jgi:hypothetical protein
LGTLVGIRCHALVAFALSMLAGVALAADDPIDDEAMVRAKRAGVSADVAAYTNYYPEWIDNYFAGMDVIAVQRRPADTPSGAPINQFDTPVYQLMDTLPPEPVEKIDPIRLRASARIDKAHNKQCRDVGQEVCEVLGRNTWMMWSGGNEGFWDGIGRQFGILDFLRLLDTRESNDPKAAKSHDREGRFARAGLINEPGMGPSLNDPDNVLENVLGLRLDEPLDKDLRDWRRRYVRLALHLDDDGSSGQTGAPYGQIVPGSAAKYPSGKSWDERIPPPEIYGLSSGVVGLRLFPNPNFDRKALERWREVKDKYANDPIGDPSIVRPFRVGMSCAFCHASFHPLNPPRDIANPTWANISGSIGAQYLKVSGVFGSLLPRNNFVFQVLDSQPPGTVDTSLVASDNINNPNTMNSVFNLTQRMLVSFRNPKEFLDPATTVLPSAWAGDPPMSGLYPDPPPLAALQKLIADYWKVALLKEDGSGPSDAEIKQGAAAVAAELAASNEQSRRVPRILLDGSDSIGAWGALARVYLNIGTNYEQWNTLHDPIVGLTPQLPFKIDNVEHHSVYWAATKLRVGPLRDYFIKVTPAMPLVAAALPTDTSPNELRAMAKARNLVDYSKLARGRQVFAENCIACHSSVQPPMRHEQMAKDAGGSEFYDHDPGRWMKAPEHSAYQKWAKAVVEKPEFWRTNFFSTDYRIQINYVKTNSCRAMATNALTGNMWEDFASRSYRRLPSVGDIKYFNPYAPAAKSVDSEGNNAVYSPRHHVRDKDAPEGGGGPGYYRVPTLASIWATAPFLHNNSLGKYTADPSVSGRLKSFDDSIRRLLWKNTRMDSDGYGVLPAQRTADHGLIWRTSEDSYLSIAGVYLPEILGGHSKQVRAFLDRYPELRAIPELQRPLPTAALLLLAFVILLAARRAWLRWVGYVTIFVGVFVGVGIYFLNGDIGGIRLGPIPKGTPVGLLANINADADPQVLKKTLATVRDAFIEIQSTAPGDSLGDKTKREEIMKTKVAPALLQISKCPDLVMDRGHYYPWFDDMSDDDKNALIELLKTF